VRTGHARGRGAAATLPVAREALGYNRSKMLSVNCGLEWARRVMLLGSVLWAGAAVAVIAQTPNSRGSVAAAITSIKFADVTKAAGLRSSWVSGGSGHNYYPEQMGGGGAFLDYDGDGFLDIFVAGGGSLPGFKGPRPIGSRLYRNRGDGTFADVTQVAGLESSRYAMGTVVGDYDNDGHVDLYLTTLQGNVLYRNDGRGRFLDVTARAGVKGMALSTAAAFVDYDADGWLDLFVARYMDYAVATDKGCMIRGMSQQDINQRVLVPRNAGQAGLPLHCGPHEMPTTSNLLFRNNQNGTFTDVSRASGISRSAAHGLGLAIADFNEDGRPDIYVASDGFPNLLFMNLGNGTFKEDAVRAGVAIWKNGFALAGMGTDAADYDNDGHIDILTTNYEKDPTTLYRGRGDGTFSDMSEASGVAALSWPFLKWGCRLLDFDGDGRRDIFVVNGHVDPAGTPGRPLNFPDDKWPGKGFAQEAQLFVSTPNGKFGDASASAGPFFREKHVARGAAFGDFDNDGDWDVLTNNIDEPALLLANQTPAFRWGRLELQGDRCNRDALGARVRVTTGGVVQTEYVRSAGSYLSDHDRRPLFSLPGSAGAVAEIRWPCGATQKVTMVPKQTVRVKEAGCLLRSKKAGQ
jgi:hypothetical protein